MKTLILQNLTHRGTVLAEGFVLSAGILPEIEMRRRILAVWQPGAKILRSDKNLIVLLPQPQQTNCRRAAGLPLVRYGEILAAFPLRKKDLEFLADSGETIVLSIAGHLETLIIRDLPIEKVEHWFDVSDFQVIETATLGEVKARPAVIEKIDQLDLRGELKNVPPADREMAEILQILKQKQTELEKNKANNLFSGRTASGSLAGNIGGFFDAFKNLFRGDRNSTQTSAPADAQPNPPGRLMKAVTKALFQMKLAQLLGRKQAQYLAKMMEMFENGDLDEALKHAIPLEDMQALKEMSEKLPFLGFLSPRANLQINYQRQPAAGSSVILENQWFDQLRQLYRQTFDRLVAQNRIEEAAFVLAELLKSNQEAVEFLEKHGKHRLAAELAESRNLSKEVIVRQWFLAGEKRRALQLAVLHNCFEYVVTKLEGEKHPQAAELRQIWAESLAISGNLKAAINTIWRLEEKRLLAADWIDQVIAFGGAAGAEMLAKKIVLLPENFTEVKTKLLEILADSGDEAIEKRSAFAREALTLAPNNELRLLARPLARKILADSAGHFRRFTSQHFRQFIELTGDYTLRTDLPKLFETVGAKESEPLVLEIAENDRGANRIYDAHLLPDGKIAVALGEAGVKMLSRNGKTIAHFDQPTEQFVVSDFGTKALCLARRGEVHRLAKIDFLARTSVYWCDAKIDKYAPTFDGNLWFIAEKDALYAVDANAKNFEAVWNVTEVGGQIYDIARSKNRLMLLIANQKGIEKWWYDLPQFTLRSRNEPKWLAMENENQTLHSIASFVAYTVVQIAEADASGGRTKFEARIYDYDAPLAKVQFSETTLAAGKPQICERVFAISSLTENAVSISLYSVPQEKLAEITLKGSKNVSLRLDEKNLTVTDELGRILVFDHQQKVLRQNIRI